MADTKFDFGQTMSDSEENRGGSIERLVETITRTKNGEMVTKTPIRALYEHVQPIRRAHEEKYLREPSETQRMCRNALVGACIATAFYEADFTAMGQAQQMKFNEPFALREFLTPGEEEEVAKNDGVLPAERNECILCMRSAITSFELNARADNITVSPETTSSSICNFVGIKGEYMPNHCLISLPNRYTGLALPVVLSSRSYHKPFLSSGMRCLHCILPFPE